MLNVGPTLQAKYGDDGSRLVFARGPKLAMGAVTCRTRVRHRLEGLRKLAGTTGNCIQAKHANEELL